METRHKDSGAIRSNAHCALSRFDETVQKWVAARTSARWEKKVAGRLSAAGIPVFLPTWTRVTRYKSRRNVSELPLFSGYLFLDETRLHDLSKLDPATKRYIAQVLKPPDYAVLREELLNLAKVLADERLVQARVYGSPGQAVRITRGSFRNLEGKMVRRNPSTNRFVLSVSFLGLSVEVEVAERAVQRVF